MTICNKIQTLGETMETNLNARGVSCTFGTGTGESTVLEMVEMVNGTNFKGSSDVNLKIGANRPYLLTGETTDVIVRLEDGLCEPLKNKNVIVGQSVKQDGGTISNHNDIWSTSTTSAQIKVTRTDSYTEFAENGGSNLSNSVSGLSESCIIEFDYYQVDGGNNSFMQIMDSSNAQIYEGGINLGYFNASIGNWYHFKISFNNGTMTIINETTNTTLTRSYTSTPSKFGWWTSSTITAIRFRNFIVYENITGVTDEKGEFALYNVSVTDDTTFTATYNNTITDTCTVYSCLLVDYATTNKHTDIWGNMDIFTRGNDGTRVYYQNTGSSALQRWLASRIDINGDVAIDLEIVDCTLCRLQTGRYATGSTTTYKGRNFTQKGLVHIEIKNNGTYFYFNGNLVQSDTTETNLEQVSLAVYVGANTTANAKYKDLRVYYL